MRSQLNAAVRDHGLHFPVDPGADCTLGGMAATNASGTTAVRYGVMRDQVLALEVVLADGSVVRTGGRAKKSSAGYDLTGLFVGSEGTLGVITQLTVRLHGVPEQTLAARAMFPSVEAACRAATSIVGAGVPVERVELVDGTTVQAVNLYMETDYAETPTLFVELAGSAAAVAGDRELVEELAREEGCSSFEAETDPRARARLWEARHHAAFALIAGAPGKGLMSTDACVPLSALADAIGVARAAIERRGIQGALLGHVGDGNYHAAFMVDASNPDEIRVAEEVNDEIVRDALARGGTCTGEHGIGLGKLHYLEAEHGDALPLMRSLKALLDPGGIMNPGKVVAPARPG
jgi:D-lactate dehydrogenase (cytochrome)